MSISETVTTQREWEDLAHLDPLWAILSDSEKRFGGWDWEEFFTPGQRKIDALMGSSGFAPDVNGKLLDFGCGVGRLSRALRSYFGEVYGVDISDEMIRLAREHTQSCTFLLNQKDDLSLFQDDFLNSLTPIWCYQHQATKEIARSFTFESL